MKPSWSDSPHWAKYLAKDEDGDWYWYQFKPMRISSTYMCLSGHIQRVNEKDETPWQESLEERPK